MNKMDFVYRLFNLTALSMAKLHKVLAILSAVG